MEPGEPDPLATEMIYMAVSVSVANASSYCTHSHTAATRAKGMTETQYSRLVASIGKAHQTDGPVTALQETIETKLQAWFPKVFADRSFEQWSHFGPTVSHLQP